METYGSVSHVFFYVFYYDQVNIYTNYFEQPKNMDPKMGFGCQKSLTVKNNTICVAVLLSIVILRIFFGLSELRRS